MSFGWNLNDSTISLSPNKCGELSEYTEYKRAHSIEIVSCTGPNRHIRYAPHESPDEPV